MKKLLLLLFAIAPLYVSAQGLSFDETVELINDKIKCCTIAYSGTSKLTGITATPEGIITATTSDGITYQINLLTEPKKKPDFIIARRSEVYFQTDDEKGRFWLFASPTDAKRVAGLLLHLRELCKAP